MENGNVNDNILSEVKFPDLMLENETFCTQKYTLIFLKIML